MQRLAVPAFILAFTATATDGVAATCDELARFAPSGSRVTLAAAVAGGAFKPPTSPTNAAAQAYAALPAFCRVALTLAPTSDSDIKVEVWLPLAGWNGKYQAVGNGGMAGTIPYPAIAAALVAGYAASGTDTGHVGNNADFVPGHPEKLVDFAYRAIHEMAVASKAVIRSHYGTAPTFSYFNGCSQGGRQGITSAQRHPDDFDGIVAGEDTSACLTPPQVESAKAMVSPVRHPDTGACCSKGTSGPAPSSNRTRLAGRSRWATRSPRSRTSPSAIAAGIRHSSIPPPTSSWPTEPTATCSTRTTST